ncbi:hypothetical protein EDD29_5163 [Actinocorallia herbida]|uniref:Lipoprotein LpqN n=1 Tax=Actinocorallia herbida TaxID=58109 RepID=A0A3N1D1Y2_9ACTN|nr:hypothetical protein [Actinocorallia herbida]ROO87553.1 hypothetical protein EDD29_5163 [Actinocorallia herbida]
MITLPRRLACLTLGLTAVITLSACQPGSPNATASAAQDKPSPEVNPPGDIPDNQVYVPFTVPGGTFTVKVPEGWAQSQDGQATVFTDKLNTVRIEAASASSAPTTATAQAEIAKIKASAQGFSGGQVSQAQRKAGPAILITYQEKSTPNAVTGKAVTDAVEHYTFWKSGHEAVLTLSGPVGADNVDPWRTITDSVQWAP